MIQEHKWRYLGAILNQIKDHSVGLNDFFKAISPKEEEIRECYSKNVKYNSHQVIKMMVLDRCFIIKLLCIVGGLVLNHDLDELIFNMA